MAKGDIIAYRYWNQGDCAVAVVASEGGANDVGAYIGANKNPDASTEETLQVVRANGSKLTRTEAMAFLPTLEEKMTAAELMYRP